jgi:hypothetical protein
MRKQRKYGFWLGSVALLLVVASAGCLRSKTFVFEKRQGIAAPPSKIFSIVSDLQDYPKLFPDSHKQVTIASKVQEGNGVVFDNVATYGGHAVRNRWAVTEFVRDKLIRMDNDTVGTVIVMLHQVDYDTTEETMIASVNIPPEIKDEVFASLMKEMNALKAACEKRAPPAAPADSAKR